MYFYYLQLCTLCNLCIRNVSLFNALSFHVLHYKHTPIYIYIYSEHQPITFATANSALIRKINEFNQDLDSTSLCLNKEELSLLQSLHDKLENSDDGKQAYTISVRPFCGRLFFYFFPYYDTSCVAHNFLICRCWLKRFDSWLDANICLGAVGELLQSKLLQWPMVTSWEIILHQDWRSLVRLYDLFLIILIICPLHSKRYSYS